MVEKGTIILNKEWTRKSLNEEDEEYLKVLYRPYWLGEYPICQIKIDLPDNVAKTEPFNAISTTEVPKFVGGIVIDTEAMNQ